MFIFFIILFLIIIVLYRATNTQVAVWRGQDGRTHRGPGVADYQGKKPFAASPIPGTRSAPPAPRRCQIGIRRTKHQVWSPRVSVPSFGAARAPATREAGLQITRPIATAAYSYVCAYAQVPTLNFLTGDILACFGSTGDHASRRMHA